MDLKSGKYESLIYEALKKKLEALSDKYVFRDSINSGEAPKLLTNTLLRLSIAFFLMIHCLRHLMADSNSFMTS